MANKCEKIFTLISNQTNANYIHLPVHDRSLLKHALKNYYGDVDL